MTPSSASAVPGATLPVLYSFRRCPYAMRARLAIAVSGQRCEMREIVLKNKPPEMLAVSPKATVPVLVLPGGEVIEQSLDIMLWTLRQHDPNHWLTPQLGTRDEMHALIEVNDGAFKRALDRYKYPHRYPQEHTDELQQFAKAHRASAALWLMDLQARLSRHDCLFGATASLADMAILPFVRQYACTDIGWFGQQPWPDLQRWLADWLGSDLFDCIMNKYTPWASGTAGFRFP